jgi:hypothetical protein
MMGGERRGKMVKKKKKKKTLSRVKGGLKMFPLYDFSA